jgi:hypothetical protein
MARIVRHNVCAIFSVLLALVAVTACGGGGSRVACNNCLTTAATEWSWVSGSDALNQEGSYGTLGVASASNVPPASKREKAKTDKKWSISKVKCC